MGRASIKFRTIQQRFTQGELDPLMLARSDIDQYYGGAEKMRNVFPLPQGGFKRRPGLEHLGRLLGNLTRESAGVTITAPNGGTTANANDADVSTVLTTTTPIGVINPYVVVQYDLGSSKRIGYVNLRGAALSTGTSTEFFVQVSNNGSAWTTAGAAIQLVAGPLNYTRRVHGSWRYIRFVRIGSTDLSTAVASIKDMLVFTESGVSPSRIIEFEFNVDQAYIMVVTDQNIAVFQNGVYLVDIWVPDIIGSRLKEIYWEQDADTLLIYHADVQTYRVQRMGANDQWATSLVTYTNIPTYVFSSAYTGTLTPSAVSGIVNITSSVAQFTAGMIGWVIRNPAGGYARITGFTSTTVVVASVLINFPNLTAFAASGSIEEVIWSTARGWPRKGCIYQGRQWVDGGKARPSVVYGSLVNSYYDFNFGTALDDQAIGPLSAGTYNTVEAIYPGRNLMVFTSGGENILPQTFSEPLTPKTAIIAPQTKIGSLSNMRPQEFEGGVLYVQRGGKSIQEFIYDDTQSAFGNNYVSLLSSHLVVNPQDFALRRATSTQEGAYLMMVTGDGALTVVLVLRSQGITSFTRQDTSGTFINCGADPTDMYVVVQRTVNGEAVKFLQRFNPQCYMDSSTLFALVSPQQTFTGLTQLEGVTCRILADGAVMANKTVTGGSVTLERQAATSAEIGINFSPLFKDLPTEAPTIGPLLGKKKNVSQVDIQLSDTAECIINDRKLSFRGFGPAGGGSPLDMTPPRFTGFKRVFGFLGWDKTGQVTITQENPLPMTVMAYTKRVSFQRG